MRFGAIIIGDEIMSGKRQDQHMAQAIKTLAQRGLKLDWCQYLADEPELITATLQRTLAGPDAVFSFGGIGATPDDHTRQCAARAAGVELALHPDAETEIRARFGADITPQRLMMGEFPAGSRIIPNPYNRIAAFSVRDHHFFPGFPQMAWPMLDWVLATWYPDLVRVAPQERAIVVYGAGESQLLPLMDENVARFPALKLFSLPTFLPDGGRRIELGVRGAPALVDEALAHLVAGVRAAGFRFEIVAADAPAVE